MKRFRNNSRKALAAVMSIWLSGVVFLFFCAIPMAASAQSHCPLTKAASGHCDKGKTTKNSHLVSQSSSRTLNCCAFMPAVFDKTRKIEREIQTSEPAAKLAVSEQTFEPVPQRSPGGIRQYTSLSLRQNKIFIKHHVLRI